MEELFAYYSNLLIVQYNGKPKAKATIELLTYIIFANLVLLQIQNAFDWKTAPGSTTNKNSPLDIIGRWVGVSRNYQGTLFWNKTFLSYPNSSQLVPTDETDAFQHGYSDYETFDDEGATLTYNNLGYVEQSLSDEDFRTVIGLKIIKNSINHTAKNIDDAIWQYFGGQTYYSDSSIDTGITLYLDQQYSKPFGTITSYSTNSVTVVDKKNEIIYDGYFSYSEETKTVNNQEITYYQYNLGQIYTTWDDMEITYHYPSSLETVINVCYYKNVLPAPTGVNIVLRAI